MESEINSNTLINTNNNENNFTSSRGNLSGNKTTTKIGNTTLKVTGMSYQEARERANELIKTNNA